MKECWIFGSSEITDYSFCRISEGAYIIAADGGYSHVKRMKMKPNLILGDFDSLNEPLPDDCEIIKVPSRKDDTDMMLAIKRALDAGYYEIKLCGALGGRLDHTIANIQSLEYIDDNGGVGCILEENNIVYFQSKGWKTYKAIDNMYFSLFALTDNAVLTTRGTKYNLTDYVLTRNFPLGVSNEIIEDSAEIYLKSGKLLVIYSKK